jgi:hypothetical protein
LLRVSRTSEAAGWRTSRMDGNPCTPSPNPFHFSSARGGHERRRHELQPAGNGGPPMCRPRIPCLRTRTTRMDWWVAARADLPLPTNSLSAIARYATPLLHHGPRGPARGSLHRGAVASRPSRHRRGLDGDRRARPCGPGVTFRQLGGNSGSSGSVRTGSSMSSGTRRRWCCCMPIGHRRRKRPRGTWRSRSAGCGRSYDAGKTPANE